MLAKPTRRVVYRSALTSVLGKVRRRRAWITGSRSALWAEVLLRRIETTATTGMRSLVFAPLES